MEEAVQRRPRAVFDGHGRGEVAGQPDPADAARGEWVRVQVELGRVPELVRSLLGDPARLAEMGSEMRRLSRPGAADEIAEELVALAS